MPLTFEFDQELFLPAYRHLLDSSADIDFIWGGRDSGKTAHVARQLILECLSPKYFRCILIKKTYNSIKDSQWQTIKDVVSEWGLDQYFQFNVSPLSIKCTINGHSFLCRGMDDPANLKSIANPSHAWVEEGNQLEENDWIILNTSLRTNNQKVKTLFTFNPESNGDKEEFWLFKNYFQEYYPEKNFTGSKEVKLPNGKTHTITYTSTNTTYKDNPYCKPERQAALENLAATNPYYYDVFTLGNWGKKEIKRPFFTAFDISKHVAPCQYDPYRQLYVSMDFNIDPFAIIFAHMTDHKIEIFDEVAIFGGSPEKAIEYIKKKYPKSIPTLLMTGDPGGARRDFGQNDNAGFYLQIARGLRLPSRNVVVPAAPKHRKSRSDSNYLLLNFPSLVISPQCKELIFDMQYLEANIDGGIEKKNRSKREQRGDHGDAFRYFVNTFMAKWIYTHQKQNNYIQTE
jgi:phage terminase large subunit